MDRETPILDYATAKPPDRWRRYHSIPAPTRALFWAGICYGTGLVLGDDMGSGRVILNPLTYALACCFLFWMFVYMFRRIAQEQDMPNGCKVLMCLACFVTVPAIYMVYYHWNFKRAVPPPWKEGFWFGLYLLAGSVGVFALARAIGLFAIWQKKRGGALDEPATGRGTEPGYFSSAQAAETTPYQQGNA